jgi:hypothetical protein
METFLNNLLKHIFKAKIIHIKVKRKSAHSEGASELSFLVELRPQEKQREHQGKAG